MFKRITCVSLAMLFAMIVAVNAAMRETRLTKSNYSDIEYKIQLKIKGLDPDASMRTNMKKIAEQLPMCNVGSNAEPNGYSAYVDTPGLLLEKGNYILRLKGKPSNPGKCKGTLKLRTTDITQAIRLRGERLKPGKQEIDYPGKNVYSVSYKLRFDQVQDFGDGVVSGRTLINAIERNYPDAGRLLQSILKGKDLVVPPYVPRYGSWAKIKGDAIVASEGHTKDMGLELFKFDDEVMVELSWMSDVYNTRDANIYKEFTSLLKKHGVLAEKQMTKTSYYLDYWYNRNPDKLPKQ